MAKLITNAERAKILALYEEIGSIRVVAERVGRARTTVARIVPEKEKGRVTGRNIAVARLYLKHNSAPVVARILGLQLTTVYEHIRRAGCELGPRPRPSFSLYDRKSAFTRRVFSTMEKHGPMTCYEIVDALGCKDVKAAVIRVSRLIRAYRGETGSEYIHIDSWTKGIEGKRRRARYAIGKGVDAVATLSPYGRRAPAQPIGAPRIPKIVAKALREGPNPWAALM